MRHIWKYSYMHTQALLEINLDTYPINRSEIIWQFIHLHFHPPSDFRVTKITAVYRIWVEIQMLDFQDLLRITGVVDLSSSQYPILPY